MSEKRKFYVVWVGRKPGVYDRWMDCKEQIESFKGAKYKKYDTLSEAADAFQKGAPSSLNIYSARKLSQTTDKIVTNALAVDAACSGNPGIMEFRGVWVESGKEAFHFGPYKQGTNNIGEFLALVYGLGLIRKSEQKCIIYTDSENALSWIRAKKCRTKLTETETNKPIFDLIHKSEEWLKKVNPDISVIYKWQTDSWGEIPADFGRKKK